MAFQTSVPVVLVSGYIGEIAFDGPSRAKVCPIAADAVAADCLIGHAYTYADEAAETVRPGGTGTFAGIAILPKTHARLSLSDSLLLEPGTWVELLTMGEVYVALQDQGATIGGSITYDTTTGALSWTDTPTTPPGGHALVPNATVQRHNAGIDLAVARLTN